MLEVNNLKNLSIDAILRTYGIDTQKTNREYRSFTDVFDDIRKEWDKLSEEQQKALIKVFLGE